MSRQRIALLTAVLIASFASKAISATKYWRGDAAVVQKVVTATPENVEIGDVFTLSLGSRSVSFTAAAATVANVTAGLFAAWQANNLPEFQEITASDNTTHLSFLADTAGKDFVLTSSTSDGGMTNDQALVIATTTANAGPHDWSVASNWEPSGVPANGDDVFLANSDVDILYGLDQSGVTLGSLQIQKSFVGKLGLPIVNAADYVEYRPTYLKIGATSLTIGDGVGAGSSRLKLDTGSVQTSLVVSHTNLPESGQQAAFYWKGSNASNSATILRGAIGLAILPGETCTLSALNVGEVEGSGDSLVTIGSGSTIGTVNQVAGAVTSKSSVTTLNLRGGLFAPLHTASITTCSIRAGELQHFSSGTITTLEIAGGTANFAKASIPRAVTNCTLYTGGAIRDPGKRVTWTNGIKLNNTNPTAVTLDIGDHMTLTIGGY